MPLRTREELEATFFEIDGGPATRTLIVGPTPAAPTPANQRFAVTIAAIFREASQSVTVDQMDVETREPSILCMTADLEGVKPRFAVRFLGLLPGEDGYGKRYEVTPRIVSLGREKTRVYLKELP